MATRKKCLLLSIVLNFKAFTFSYEQRCPSRVEWNKRATILCGNMTYYYCLLNPLFMTYVEGCHGPEWDRPGSKLVFQGNFNRGRCKNTRFQPIKFLTQGNTECLFLKSLCSEKGQHITSNNSSIDDATCSCDSANGYKHVFTPKDVCFCKPFQEDCSCYLKKCFLTEDGCDENVNKNGCLYIQTDTVNNTEKGIRIQMSTDIDILMITGAQKTSLFIIIIVGLLTCLGMTAAVILLDNIADCFIKNLPSKRTSYHTENETSTEHNFEKEIERLLTETQVDQTHSENETQLAIEIDTLRETVQKGEIKDIQKQILDKLDRWKKESVRFGIAGETGVGKSSFVNSFCNFKEGDSNYAKVGQFGNTTKKPTKYVHPVNAKIELFDLPGFGTLDYPMEKYEVEMDLKSYDYVIIFVGNILKQNDLIIAMKLQELQVPFCFVRSKLDQDLKNMKPEEFISRVKRDALKYCNQKGIRNLVMFVISSLNRRIGEFSNLIQHMMACLSELKSESVMLSLGGDLSSSLIEMKYKWLKKRIPAISIAVGAAAAVPVPGVDVAQ